MRPPSWYFVFTGDRRQAWWNLFTFHRPGFQHVAAYRYCPDAEVWFYVDWHARALTVDTMGAETVDAIIAAASAGEITVLKVEGKLGRKRLMPGFCYCVTAMKQLVGLRAWWALTPWQLYCALRARGAAVMYRKHEQPPEEAEGAGARP